MANEIYGRCRTAQVKPKLSLDSEAKSGYAIMIFWKKKNVRYINTDSTVGFATGLALNPIPKTVLDNRTYQSTIRTMGRYSKTPLRTENGKQELADELHTKFNKQLTCPNCFFYNINRGAFNKDWGGTSDFDGSAYRRFKCRSCPTCGRTIGVTEFLELCRQQLLEPAEVHVLATSCSSAPGSPTFIVGSVASSSLPKLRLPRQYLPSGRPIDIILIAKERLESKVFALERKVQKLLDGKPFQLSHSNTSDQGKWKQDSSTQSNKNSTGSGGVSAIERGTYEALGTSNQMDPPARNSPVFFWELSK
ncbi:hypothetical protein C7212DRAFT_347595 [Tuber magnatum]|uniref:Uncharacterized protein n=1 Tax=Tuber magnatum TaxID=42249 RepID=A0A317SEP3_9PEZI|nr:hypothetical protein C7212DRAFT_347595 [Tuber magnatum]